MHNNKIIHDYIYEWDGKKRAGNRPICWWPGSYRIRVVNLAADAPEIFFLRPKAVICQNNGSGTSIHNCVQNFAKEISKKFDLKMEKVLWVEISPKEPFDIQVITFTLVTDIENNRLFSATWRDARPNELKTIEPYLADFLGDE